jgi:tetratricopeptide (TPR) repeat protein
LTDYAIVFGSAVRVRFTGKSNDQNKFFEKGQIGLIMSIERSKKFGICRFCGARVKIENMATHERKVHPGLDSKEEEESSHEEREIELNEDGIRALCRKASKLLQRGAITEAIKKFERVLKFDPDNYGAWNDLGLAWKEMGNKRKALEAFDKSLELKPDLSCAWVNKAQLLLSRGKKDEALRCCEEALKYDDKIIQAWYNKGSILASMGLDEEAIRCFDAALALNDEYYMAWMSKGLVLLSLGEEEESRICLEKAYSLNPAYAWKALAGTITGENLEHVSGMRAKKKKE